MNNLFTAIYGKLSGSTLSTYIGGRLFNDEAPENTEFPYMVFKLISDIPEYPGGKIMENVRIQFSIFSISSSVLEITTALSYLQSLYDDCSLTITSNTLVYFIRGMLTTMYDDITTPEGTVGLRHYAQEYNITMTR
jgi:hypothetical protein